MTAQPGADPVCWIYTILLSEGTTLAARKKVISDLNESGIGSRPLWHPIHSLKPYRGCQAHMIDHSVRLYQRAVSLPSSVGLTDQEQERTVAAVKAAVQALETA